MFSELAKLFQQFARGKSQLYQQVARGESQLLQHFARDESQLLQQFSRSKSQLLQQFARGKSQLFQQFARGHNFSDISRNVKGEPTVHVLHIFSRSSLYGTYLTLYKVNMRLEC